MRYRFHPHAEIELNEAVDYYEARRSGLGKRFRRAFEAALNKLLDHPTAWALIDPPCRLCRLRKFPYGIVYELRDDEVVVIAVMHLHREPGYWRNRRGP